MIVLIVAFAVDCTAPPVGNGIIGSGTGAVGGDMTRVVAGAFRGAPIVLRAGAGAASVTPIAAKPGASISFRTSVAPDAVA